jgi:hypothetical protein
MKPTLAQLSSALIAVFGKRFEAASRWILAPAVDIAA